MVNEYPKNFARFYDTLYQDLRNGVDNEFYLNHIKRSYGKILEIGVGTGRFFIDALKTGADIYGIDVSKNMLHVLRDKLKKDQYHRIDNQDIVDFYFDFNFDLIIAPFRVIMHVINKNEQIQALNNVYKHLANNGKFIFDIFVPDLKQLLKGLNNVTDFDGQYNTGKWLRRTVSTQPDLINQLIHVHFKLEWEEHDKIMEENWKTPLRFFFRYELEHLIERSDFKKYEIFGDYEGNDLNEKSKEFVVMCVK